MLTTRCVGRSVGHETTIISGQIEPSTKVQYFTEMATDRYPISDGILNSLWTSPVRIRGEAAPKLTCVSMAVDFSRYSRQLSLIRDFRSALAGFTFPKIPDLRTRDTSYELFIQFATRHHLSNLFANLEDFFCDGFLQIFLAIIKEVLFMHETNFDLNKNETFVCILFFCPSQVVLTL